MPQFSRSRRWPARLTRLRCEQLEGRLAPAVFNVQAPMSFTGLNNNGCVAVTDLKGPWQEVVLTVHSAAELETPGFAQFLDMAIEAAGRGLADGSDAPWKTITLDSPPPARKKKAAM